MDASEVWVLGMSSLHPKLECVVLFEERETKKLIQNSKIFQEIFSCEKT